MFCTQTVLVVTPLFRFHFMGLAIDFHFHSVYYCVPMGTADGNRITSLFAGTRSCLTIVFVQPVSKHTVRLPSWKTSGLGLTSSPSKSLRLSTHSSYLDNSLTLLVTCETSNVLEVSSCSFGLDAVVSVHIHTTIFGFVSCTLHTRQWSYFPLFRPCEWVCLQVVICQLCSSTSAGRVLMNQYLYRITVLRHQSHTQLPRRLSSVHRSRTEPLSIRLFVHIVPTQYGSYHHSERRRLAEPSLTTEGLA